MKLLTQQSVSDLFSVPSDLHVSSLRTQALAKEESLRSWIGIFFL